MEHVILVVTVSFHSVCCCHLHWGLPFSFTQPEKS